MYKFYEELIHNFHNFWNLFFMFSLLKSVRQELGIYRRRNFHLMKRRNPGVTNTIGIQAEYRRKKWGVIFSRRH